MRRNLIACVCDVLARGDTNGVTGSNLVSANVIPAAQLCDAYAETLRDGAECVSAADAIEGSGGSMARMRIMAPS